jgi:uncharacterized repeat protein (TIGR03803 family)
VLLTACGGGTTILNNASGVNSLEINLANSSFAKGTSAQLSATDVRGNDHADVSSDLSWTSSDTSVATVSSSGKISAVGTGTAVITGTCAVASVCGSASASITVTVTAASLLSIALTPPAARIAPGTSEQLTATGTFSDNSTQNLSTNLTWTSSNPAVASVSSSGLVSSVGAGSATITATCKVASVCGSLAGTTTLTVTTATLVSIAITPPAARIAAGTSQQLTATGTFSDNSTQNLSTDLTWTSSNPAVARVSSSGLVSSVGAGSATITATCRVASVCGSLAGNTTVTVTSATLVSIAITPPGPSVALNTNQTFTATGTYSDNSQQNLTTQVTWTSGTPAVATISNAAGTAGVAHAVTAGATQITAALGSVTSPTDTLTVTSASLVSIAITPPGASIPVSGSQQFVATGTYSDSSTQILTTQVTWTSATPATATISNAAGTAGLAHPVATGTTQITAALNSVSAPAVTLTVTAVTLVSIAVTPTGPSIQVAASEQFVATGTYSDNSTQVITTSVTWASATTSVAAISNANNSQGLASALQVGSSSITASQGSVQSAPVTLTVTGQVESVLHSFGSGNDGQTPEDGLIQATDGNFYGTTSYGGVYSDGTVFKITPAGVETLLYSFGSSASDGAHPWGALIQGTDGNFYGTTVSGGTHSNAGTVFKITPAGSETVLWSFGGGTDGTHPYAGLLQGVDGNFYGTTLTGGANTVGTVFKITPAGVETVLWSFGSGTDGTNPEAGLILASDGNFYGTTQNGGVNSAGTVFKITPAGAETVLYSFASSGDGTNPYAALVQGADGNFYGTTQNGGADSVGTVYTVTPAGAETLLYSFGGVAGDGSNPYDSLIQAADGNFYGTTNLGGANNVGVIFKITPGGVETVVYSFGSNGAYDGGYPYGGLIQGTDGNFYATTSAGGQSSFGSVFKF